jgi:hypothetical protein
MTDDDLSINSNKILHKKKHFVTEIYAVKNYTQKNRILSINGHKFSLGKGHFVTDFWKIIKS